MNKNKELLDSFVAFCNEHPEYRFWQALRNWCGWPFVYVSDSLIKTVSGDQTRVRDTFYWENNREV